MKSPVIGGIALVIGVVLYITLQVVPLLDDRDTGVIGLASHANDYKHVYMGSILLNDGLDPYPPDVMRPAAGSYSQTEDIRFRTILPYVYLPFTGMVMTPLTWFSFPTSVVVFQILNHLLLLGGLILLASISGLWKDRKNALIPGLILIACAFNTTVFRQNNAGQLNMILIAGYAVVYTAIVRQWSNILIGFLAAFLMLFKLSPGILLFWFLFRREWSRAGWMTAWALILTGITVAVYGIDTHLDFIPVLQQMGFGKSTWPMFHTFWRDPYNQSVNALLHKLFVEREGSGVVPWLPLSPAIANGVTWVFALSTFGFFGWRVYTLNSRGADLPVSFSLAVCTSLLLPSIMWDHYLVQALIPVLLLLSLPGLAIGWKVGLLAIVAVFSLPIPLHAEAFRSGAGLLLMNAKLYPMLALFAIIGILTFRENLMVMDNHDAQ